MPVLRESASDRVRATRAFPTGAAPGPAASRKVRFPGRPGGQFFSILLSVGFALVFALSGIAIGSSLHGPLGSAPTPTFGTAFLRVVSGVGTHSPASTPSAPQGAQPLVMAQPTSTPFSPGLNASTSVAMAFDSADGYLLAVAQNLSSTGLPSGPMQSWSFDGHTWSRLATVGAPTGRLSTSLAYDPTLGAVVLFGGLGPVGFLSDTWLYEAGAWTNVSLTAGAPPAMAGAGFAYDAADHADLLYGGVGANGTNFTLNSSSGVLLTPTWLFSAGHWTTVTQAAASAPAPRGALAYDPSAKAVVAFGGVWNASRCALSDATYRFSGGSWSPLNLSPSASPIARAGAGFLWDSASASLVLYGGTTCQGFLSDSYSFSSGRWTNVSGLSGPSARSEFVSALDPSTGSTVVFGGLNATGPLGDTWSYTSGQWTYLGPKLQFTVWNSGGFAVAPSVPPVTDTGLPITVATVGALPIGATAYTYLGLPTGCLSFDGARFNCTANLGGSFRVGLTVISSAGEAHAPQSSVEVNAAPNLVSLSFSRMVTEPGIAEVASAYVVGGTSPLSYAFTGLPPGCLASGSSSFTCVPTAAGSYNVVATVSDALGVVSSQSASLLVNSHPIVSLAQFSPEVIDVGMTTHLVAAGSGGLGTLSLGFSGLPPGCASQNVGDLACSPRASGAFSVVVTATDSAGFLATRTTSLTVHPALSLDRFSVSTPGIVLGGSVSFQLELSGGTAPYSVAYSGLPVGCADSNATVLTCAPGVVGSFTVGVSVQDAVGEVATASASLQVDRAPSSPVTNPNPGGGHPSPGGGFSTGLFAQAFVSMLALASVAAIGGLYAEVRRRQGAEGRDLVAALYRDADRLAAEGVEAPFDRPGPPGGGTG